MADEPWGGPDGIVPGHAAIVAVRKLRRPQERRAAGVCLAEGPHLIAEALQAGWRPIAAFAARPWSLGDEGRQLTADLRRALHVPERLGEVPLGVHLVPERVFQRLSDTVSPQGVLGIFAPPPEEPPHGPAAWTLILDGVQDPGNVGTLARALLAFGGERSVLLTGEGTADPFGEKALRASAGACFRLRHRPAGAEGLAGELRALRAQGVRLWALCPRGGTALPEAPVRPPAALVVGSEGRGASEEALALCAPLTVPMPGHAESLNAALAGAIALYEAAGRANRA